MATRFEAAVTVFVARASNPAFWRGVSVFASLIGGKYANLEWGECAAVAAAVSALLKMLFPEVKITQE